MFDYSVFERACDISLVAYEVPISRDYKVWINGTEVPVYTCRVSAYPFNIEWPGHQRPLEQSEEVSYVNFVSDEAIEIAVEPLTKTAYERIMIKPYAKKIAFWKHENQIVFRLKQNGGYVLELDDYHGLLYLFNHAPIASPSPEEVTYYFGSGVHFPGKLALKSGESVYIDKNALVYGCIYAENAENIHIYGNGIMDDSCEERVAPYCYDAFCNGNLKFYDCKNIRVEGIGLVNSAIWCVNLFHCFDAVLDGINVFGQWRYNTDGIDIVNSQRITVKNSFIHSFDDTVTIKGIDRYAFENNRDILVENCVLWCDWGKTMEIGLETECEEYAHIIFRGCDLLRAGNTACDIQNGDRAYVHDVVFENISMELEDFYTPSELQDRAEKVYDRNGEIEIACLLNITNRRYRGKEQENCEGAKSPSFAGVDGITVKNVQVYCGEKIMAAHGTQCVKIRVRNGFPATRYRNIVVENVYLNGVKVTEEEMSVGVRGTERECLEIRA